MGTDDFTDSLCDAHRQLRAAGVNSDFAKQLRHTQNGQDEALSQAVVADVPAFRTSGNPDVLPELDAHMADIAAAVCVWAERPQQLDLGFVREHARRRAQQKFPLDAELAAYRSVARILLPWVRDAATLSADETAQLRKVVAVATECVVELASAISSLMTSEYVAHTRELAESEGDRRTELFNTLLGGYDEADARAAQLLRRSGYLQQRQSFCVLVARSVEAREMDNPARAQRMLDAVVDALSNLAVRVLPGFSDNLAVVIVSGTRRMSGWTAAQSLLADRIDPSLRTIGTAALIGVSLDAPSTSHIPAALTQAKLALDFANVAQRVMPYARIPFRDIVISAAAERARAALPPWYVAFAAADAKSRGKLTATLRAYADADMNALRTAKELGLHPNTVYARMQRIQDVTAVNPLSFNGLTELLLACAVDSR